jgi:hypothetical protein
MVDSMVVEMVVEMVDYWVVTMEEVLVFELAVQRV